MRERNQIAASAPHNLASNDMKVTPSIGAAAALKTAATYLFEQPGTLQEVARLAAKWFKWYLGRSRLEQATAD
jgi:hypothetical protein